jgi:hypothetical protein
VHLFHAHIAHRRSHSNWSQSGTALSLPLYHYVLPITICDAGRAAKYGDEVIKNPSKRWDTLAWFEITVHKGDFTGSFNLGAITGGFGIASSGSSKATPKSAPPTVQKLPKKTLQNEPITSMPSCLAEYMQLNLTKTNLAATIAETGDDDESNKAIMKAIDRRRKELAALLTPTQNE